MLFINKLLVSTIRNPTKSLLSVSDLKPAKGIIVPGKNLDGKASQASSASGVQTIPDSRRAPE